MMKPQLYLSAFMLLILNACTLFQSPEGKVETFEDKLAYSSLMVSNTATVLEARLDAGAISVEDGRSIYEVLERAQSALELAVMAREAGDPRAGDNLDYVIQILTAIEGRLKEADDGK